MATVQPKNHRWLHAYATFVAFATFLLIIAGALVTSNDAGLSVPDWPTSFGSFRMPRMVGGVLYEHGHRIAAATVVLLTIFLALWLWKHEPRRWVKKLGGMAILTILAQAILGGITVLFYLPIPVSVGHACLAQIFFCLTVSLAMFTQPDWIWDQKRTEDTSRPSLRSLATATTGLIFLQLMLGAAFRHHGFGIIPHVAAAGLVTGGVFWLLARVLGNLSELQELKRSVLLLAGLVTAQILLGAGSYLMLVANRDAPQPLRPVVAVTTAHVAVGALVLGACLVVTLRAYQLLAAPGETIRIPSDPEKAAV